ncbi:MAG: hypothetical protein QNJ90_08220 [Planctomycetota bacterium]|nr:hypothetical protein [Planctomycetota bacterium]
MPPRPHAHLMLPSPLGLLEYDVLEDAVFLGPGRRGGLRASPTPFQGACVALTRKEDGYVARPLPGEAAPDINGEAVAEKALEEGDRIRIGDQVALFRTGRGPVQAAPARAAAEPRPQPVRRSAPSSSRNPVITVITFTGLAILLAATYRAVNHLKAIQGAQISESRLPELEEQREAAPGRALRELLALNQQALRTPDRHRDLIARFEAFQRRHVDTPGAAEALASAGERVRELMEAWSTKERAALDKKVASLEAAQQFGRAFMEIRTFERRFGATKAAEGLDARRRTLRASARKALDELFAKVQPLITPQPREAHRLLIGVSHEYPADMAAEVVPLLERCVARMIAIGDKRRRTPNRPPTRRPTKGAGDPALPPFPGPDDPPEEQPPQRPETPDGDDATRDAQCRDAWEAARKDLLEARYPQALQGYTMVVQQYGNTAYYRAHKAKIAAGRRAAKVGALGPEGLVGVPVEKKKRGRIELEYHFNDRNVYEQDFTVEQPFSSDMPIQARWKRGTVVLERATGLFHKLVFLPDVTLEATVAVQQPHDFGAICVQESDDFRAILFNIANTKFKLKKGAAAKANEGHVLWYIGQGVWADADADAHGFIKIAERRKVSLKSGDRVKIELTRRKDSAQGSFQGKTDGVNLEGKVKGDDGSTMGPGRVGLFTNSGIITVESVRISGVVDMEWFRKELAFLVAADPGPPSDD